MVEAFAITSDDEQGVVDSHTQTDHRHERGGEVGHRQHVAQDDDERCANTEPDESRADRQPHGKNRSESEYENDDRGEQPVGLAGRKFEAGEDVAAVLDAQVSTGKWLTQFSDLFAKGDELGL